MLLGRGGGCDGGGADADEGTRFHIVIPNKRERSNARLSGLGGGRGRGHEHGRGRVYVELGPQTDRRM